MLGYGGGTIGSGSIGYGRASWDITGVFTAPKLGNCDEPYLNGSSKHSLNLDLCWELLLKAMRRN